MRGNEVVGQPLDETRMEQAINELYALDIFAHVGYELVEEDGRYGVHVNAMKKSWGPNFLQIGAKWNSSMDGNGILSVALSYLKTEMNSWNAEWRTTVAVGEEPGFHTDFYQPLGKGADWFTGAALLAQQFNINIYEEGSNSITEQVRIQRLGATAYAGREFGNWGRGWVGITRGGGERSVSIGDPTIPDEDFDIGEATFTLEADRLDSLYFSRHGHSALAMYRFSDKGLGASENFEQVVFSGRIARSFGKHTLIAYGDYKSTISGVAPPERLFRVGGLFNLSGFEYNQLSGQNFAQVAAVYRRDFVNLGPLSLSVGMSLELGNVWENRSDMGFDDALFGGSLFLGSNTPFGPVYFGWGQSEQSDGSFYVSLGAVRNDPVLQ
jgi:NTE family protein